jgi:hypothetical protein
MAGWERPRGVADCGNLALGGLFLIVELLKRERHRGGRFEIGRLMHA